MVWAAPVTASEFTVEDWALSVGIGGSFPDSEAAYFLDPELPFHQQHQVNLHDSLSFAEYDFDNSQFLIQTAQLAEAPMGATSSYTIAASGHISVAPQRDLSLQYALSYDFNLPVDPMSVFVNVRVDNVSFTEHLFSDAAVHDTLFGTGPGSFAFDGEVTLPAGDSWRLSYLFRIIVDDSTAGSAATGNGFVQFNLIPEPATGALLALAGPFAFRRRRHA